MKNKKFNITPEVANMAIAVCLHLKEARGVEISRLNKGSVSMAKALAQAGQVLKSIGIKP